MNNKIHRTIIALMFFILLCGVANAKVEVKEIVIQNTYNDDKITEEQIYNCDGNFPSKTVSVTLSNSEALEVRGGQSLTAGAKINVFGVDFSLSSTIQSEVVRKYGSSISHGDSIVLTANVGENILHKIRHNRKYVKGYVLIQKTEYFINKKTKMIPFTYCISYKLTKIGERKELCPMPYLKIQNVDIFPHSGCQNNFKNYKIFIIVQDLGNRFSDNVEIFANIFSYQTKHRQTFPIVQNGYIAVGKSMRYQGWASMQCNAFPKGSSVNVKFEVHYKLPYNKGNV